MRISDWSSDVCSSDLAARKRAAAHPIEQTGAKLRAMMPWIGANKLVDKEKNLYAAIPHLRLEQWRGVAYRCGAPTWLSGDQPVRKYFASAAVLAAAFALGPVVAKDTPALPGAPDPARVQAGTYAVDPMHTQVAFTVNHFGFSNYVGLFGMATGSLTIDPEIGRAHV